ncbi:hypothetical protein KEM55_002784 [Ascosphaera atra]|nr:hypothetical protein KEM55_002784 [Ascosphaera atra]
MEREIQSRIPGIDRCLSTYSAGYLSHASETFVEDQDPNGPSPLSEAAEVVTELLLSASGDFSKENEASIRELVNKFVSSLNTASGVEGKRVNPVAAKKLDQAIHVGSQRNISSTLGLAGGSVDLDRPEEAGEG